jgi:chemotaxis protein CheZ
VTRVYEACNFQDITGQRITKIVKTLQHIEVELDKIVGLFGDFDGADTEPREKKTKPEAPSDESLLNGPQLTETAATQEEIDALLASFD